MNEQYNGLPARAVEVHVTTTAANGIMAPSMPAVPGWLNVLVGYDITGGGATAASVINVATTGLAVELQQRLVVPAGATTNATNAAWTVRPPFGRKASAANVAVTVTVPAFGAGNTAAAVNIYGYRVPA